MSLVVPAWPGQPFAVGVSASTTLCLWQQSPAQVALGWSPCPPTAVVCLLGTFLLGTAQKAHTLCPLVGWPMVKVWKTLSSHHLGFWEGLQGPSWSGSCWKQRRVSVGFSVGVWVQDVAATWLAKPSQPLWLGLALTPPAADPSALGAWPPGIPSPAGSSAKLIRAALGNNEISRLIWPDSRTSTEASVPVGVSRASGGSGAADPQGCPLLLCSC